MLWNQKYDSGTLDKSKILQSICNSHFKEKDINSNELSLSTTSINKSNNKLIQIVDTIPNQLLPSNQISYYTSLSSSSIIKK